MIRPIFALFNRALREDNRAKAPYIARTTLAGVLLVFLFFAQATSMWMGAPGLIFFGSVVQINFFFITLAGLGYFASAITEEKEEMTMGLLRMTDLNPLSILLGKSTSRLFGAVLLLLAQFPFTLLAVSLGGVSVGQVVATYFTFAAYVFLLSNVALFFSVTCKRTGAAAVFTGVFLFLFFIGPHWVLGLTHLAERFGWIKAGAWLATAIVSTCEMLIRASPFTRLTAIMRTGFADGPIGFQFLANLATGLLFFGAAWLCFDRFTRNETEATPRRGFLFRRTSSLRIFGPGRAGSRALLWKDFHFQNGGKMGVLVRLTIYCLLVVYTVSTMRKFTNSPAPWWSVGYATMVWMYLLFMLEMALAASRMFRQEIKWQTLSSLCMLPVSLAELVRQKVLASLLAGLPALVIFSVGFCLVFEDFVKSLLRRNGGNYEIGFLIMAALESIFFLLLVLVLSLILKRGALALAIGVTYMGNMILGVVIGFAIRDTVGTMVIMATVLIICSGFLLAQIGPRLARAMATD